nr:reverse transcriptase domain-containing protein [Tanacetum cinerariifolium]
MPISKLGCVLSQDFLRFVSRPPAFCLKTWLRFVSRLLAFCLKTSCVLSQDLLRFVSRLGRVLSQDFMRFVSRPLAFCLKTYCVLSQELLRFVFKTNHLVPNNQIPPSVPNEFLSYMKSNEIMIKSMQNQINVLRGDFNKHEENLMGNLNNDMRSILGSFFLNQPSTSGTLPSNTVPNPKGEMKAVITRSGLAYERPLIPTESPLEKVDEQNTEEILDKEHSNSSGSTAQVQPPVVHILIPELDSLLANKDKLFELAKVPLNENFSAMLLKKLPEKLGDPDPFQLPPMDLKLAEESKEKSSIEEPPELELKELPSYLEYAFLEDSNKFPVIIAKNLKVDEKEAIINVLKSHKRDIA